MTKFFYILFAIIIICLTIKADDEDSYTYVSDLSQNDCINKKDEYGSYYYHVESENVSPYCRPFKYTYTAQICTQDPKKDAQICSTAYTCSKKCSGTNQYIPCKNDTICDPDGDGRRKCKPFCIAIKPDFNKNNVGTCLAYYAKTKDYEDTFYSAKKFKPACLNDGTWAPKQCKGGATGRCFCYNSVGERLFGQAHYKDSEKMTCACSRRKYELTNSYDVYSSLHCDSIGNFEPLQCDRGLCWCAESQTGDLTSPIVPESNIKRLPCYDVNKVGDKYLRQCDSKLWAISKISYKFKLHGVKELNLPYIDCDYDGAYGRFSIDSSGVAHCTWRDNTILSPYQTVVSHVTSYSEITCFCARDERMKLNQQPCAGTGNYEVKQPVLVNKNYYCLDIDGFQRNDGEADATKLDCSKLF